MKRIVVLFVVVFSFLLSSSAQETTSVKPSAENKYPLETVLVLTPEQCKMKSEKGNWMSGKEKYEVGKLLCPAAESVVQQVFEKFTRVETVPSKENTTNKVLLTVQFIDLEATKTMTAFGKRKMVLLVEWTATDETGKVIWVQTIEGNAEGKMGNAFTAGKNRKKLLENAKNDLIAKSVEAMKQSPEFRKLAQKGKENK
jgi:hypothetical protein